MATLEQAPTSNFWSTSLNGAINDSVETITLNSTTGLQAPGRLVINRQDSAGTNTPSSREVIAFTGISGSDLTGVTRGADNSTARSHADGSLVESAIVVGNWDTLYDVIDQEHNTDGTHDTTKVVDLTTTQTLTNKLLSTPTLATPTLTSPKLNEDVALTSTSTELNALDAKTGEWSTSTPTVVATSGTITTLGTVSCRYIQIGKIVFINMSITITTNGTGADAVRATLPVNAKGITYCAGRDETTGGEMLSVGFSGGYAYIRKYNNFYPGGDGARLVFGGTYEAA